MKRHVTLMLVVALLTVGSGCVAIETQEKAPVERRQEKTQWQEVSEGAERLLYQFGETTYDRLVMYRFDPDRFQFEIQYAADPKPVSQWLDETPDGVFAVNGSYFHEDQYPSGFLIVDGAQVGDRRFDQNRSGIITLDPTVEIIDTSTEETSLSTLTEAMQSYPFLVTNGRITIETDSGMTGRRSFFGTDREGRVYIGVVPSTRVSLYQLARIMKDLPVDWEHILNLDGGTSTGFSARFNDRQETADSLVPVPFVIMVTH